jgi:hypothetical protein
MKLAEIFRVQPRAAAAFRNLENASDDDLRMMLEDATPMIERMS